MRTIILAFLLIVSVTPAFAQKLKWEIQLTNPPIDFDQSYFDEGSPVVEDGLGGVAVRVSYIVNGTQADTRITWISKSQKVVTIDFAEGDFPQIFRLTGSALYVALRMEENTAVMRKYMRTRDGVAMVETPLTDSTTRVRPPYSTLRPAKIDTTGFFMIREKKTGSAAALAVQRYSN